MMSLTEKLQKENMLLFPSEGVDSPSDLSLVEGRGSSETDDDSDVESIGEPLQASSPSLATGMEGGGDCLSLRSILGNGLPSSVHRSFGNHHINCTTMQTPSPSSSWDTLINNFDKPNEETQPDTKLQKQHSVRQELLTAKIDEMSDAEVKKLLAKVLVDNLGLKKELKSKEQRISAYQGHMLAILDLKVEQTDDEILRNVAKKRLSTPSFLQRDKRNSTICGCHSESTSFQKGKANQTFSEYRDTAPSHKPSTGLPSPPSLQEITMVEEVYGIRRSLSFFQEFASSIEVDQEMLKERIKDGCYLTNQLLIGGVSGWATAIFLKKFGKIALSAAGGGLVLLAYSTRKGYVNVNYDSIYREISRFCDDSRVEVNIDENSLANNNEDNGEGGNASLNKSENNSGKTKSLQQDSWSLEKVRSAKKWISSHTYTVGGFVLSFVYNIV